jgi:hypothetical protein
MKDRSIFESSIISTEKSADYILDLPYIVGLKVIDAIKVEE